METFLAIINGDEKHDIVNGPDIVGPFPNSEAAMKFMEGHPRYSDGLLEPIDGGYAGWEVVNADSAERPEDYAENYGWNDQE